MQKRNIWGLSVPAWGKTIWVNEINRRVKIDNVKKGWGERSPLENVHRVWREEEENETTEWSSKKKGKEEAHSINLVPNWSFRERGVICDVKAISEGVCEMWRRQCWVLNLQRSAVMSGPAVLAEAWNSISVDERWRLPAASWVKRFPFLAFFTFNKLWSFHVL